MFSTRSRAYYINSAGSMVGSCKPTTCTNFLEEDVMNLQQALAFLAGLKPVPLSDQIEMPIKDRYEFEDLIDAGCRKWRNTAPLPLPPMLMFDTITELSKTGGEHVIFSGTRSCPAAWDWTGRGKPPASCCNG